MLAHVDQGVGIEVPAQPGVEGQIAVRRRQSRIVIAGGRVDVIAARRLDAQDHVAERQQRQREAVVHDMRVGGRLAPAIGD